MEPTSFLVGRVRLPAYASFGTGAHVRLHSRDLRVRAAAESSLQSLARRRRSAGLQVSHGRLPLVPSSCFGTIKSRLPACVPAERAERAALWYAWSK